jgi:hypothetical protein
MVGTKEYRSVTFGDLDVVKTAGAIPRTSVGDNVVMFVFLQGKNMKVSPNKKILFDLFLNQILEDFDLYLGHEIY